MADGGFYRSVLARRLGVVLLLRFCPTDRNQAVRSSTNDDAIEYG